MEMKDQRRWEDLNTDCLVNIFGKVGVDSLLLDVPFVCKTWFRASLDPSCWEFPTFPKLWTDSYIFDIDYEDQDFNTFADRCAYQYQVRRSLCTVASFVQFIVNRSRGYSTSLRLPVYSSNEELRHIADVCPGLKVLALPRLVQTFNLNRILEIIGNWKYLETLFMADSFGMEKILSQISICCKNFSCLHMFNTRISEDEAMEIVSHLPKLKQLSLINGHIGRDNLVKLLKGCKDLVLLDVRDCVGFDEGDAEILKLASHITEFSCEGSKSADKYYRDNYEEYGESELSADMYDFSEDEYGYYEDEYGYCEDISAFGEMY
uniref:F-box/LRR-repeat protein At3g48880-like isoform X1 n=1 Tax=Fragaria vesca subsp. vesca TaxID=101020 RepID=UPI0005C95DBA|nr:PREDICTED: F-box/LRR-repeat protein At3g48880-like isoform X1 [Fragaria vesca subsp. vesca]